MERKRNQEKNKMQRTQIYNLNNCPLSDRNGTYGGNSGNKEGILVQGAPWLVKYPISTDGMSRVGSLSYTASPISEYLGSHIYKILGYDVHETLLGIRNEKLVVACRDFCRDGESLVEYRQLRNTYSEDVAKALDGSSSSGGHKHFTDLQEIIAHLNHNPIIKSIYGLKQRFWETAIIDGFINNNDRNNGNWGIIKIGSTNRLAPVYDNAGAFSAKVPDSKLLERMNTPERLSDAINGNVTAYSLDGEHPLFFKDFIRLDIRDLHVAILKTVPLIKDHHSEIREFIMNVPERCAGYEILSEVRRQEYLAELEARFEQFLVPAYENCLKLYMIPAVEIDSLDKGRDMEEQEK